MSLIRLSFNATPRQLACVVQQPSSKFSNLIIHRNLHSSGVSQGWLDWVTRKKPGKKVEDERLPTLPIKESLKQIETEGVKQEHVKLRIIGKPTITQIPLNGFKIPSWKKGKKVTTLNEVDNAISKAYFEVFNKNENIKDILNYELSDLSKRFEIFKNIQKFTGYDISDYIISKSKTINDIKIYFTKNIINKPKFDDLLPNAIHLNPEEFEGSNVRVIKFINGKEKKKRYQSLLRNAITYDNHRNKTEIITEDTK